MIGLDTHGTINYESYSYMIILIPSGTIVYESKMDDNGNILVIKDDISVGARRSEEHTFPYMEDPYVEAIDYIDQMPDSNFIKREYGNNH